MLSIKEHGVEINHASRRKRKFRAASIDILLSISDRISIASDGIRLYEATEYYFISFNGFEFSLPLL